MSRSVPWNTPHQYIDRTSSAVRTEALFGDPVVAFLYAPLWEDGPALYSLLTRAWSSRLLGYLRYDSLLGSRARGMRRYLEACGVDLSECVEPPERLETPRQFFERQIRYGECRPMPRDPGAVVSPADARVLVGSLCERSALCLKGKFFDVEELLGRNRGWVPIFQHADYSIHRLTPDKYHYTHVPVAGRVVDIYEIPGRYHACNPGAVVTMVTPHSKNRRVVTILDTDASGGTGVGCVAMIEVAALMVGDVVQCYSSEGYAAPRALGPGMFLKRGAVKSLFRPGGSTAVLLFQPGRVAFAEDLVVNMWRPQVTSRFSLGFGRPLVETDVPARSLLAWRRAEPPAASARPSKETRDGQ
jgi:phosphatidylserine decarboxylase